MSYMQEYEKWLASPALNEQEHAELESIRDDEKEIRERFYGPLEFGTAGLRGTMKVGLHQMNIHVIRWATQGFANVICAEGDEAKRRGVALCMDLSLIHIFADGAQHLHGGDDVLTVLAGDAGLFILMSADGDVDAVILLLQLLQPDIPAHGDAGMYLNAKRQNGFDLGVQLLTGEAVAGDAVAQHTAQLLPLLVHRDPVTHKGQVVGATETAGASADDGHLLAGGGSALRLGYHPGVVYGIALQATDIDGIVHHIPAAAGLAGMLADIGAGRGEGIVLADQAHCISAATLPYQRHVAGDIHAGGTPVSYTHLYFMMTSSCFQSCTVR